MTNADSTRGSQAAYDFWLGLIPQFLGQFGAVPGDSTDASTDAPPGLDGLAFPVDQIAKAAALTQQSLQALAQTLGPQLQGGGFADLVAQWAKAAPGFTFAKPPAGAATAATAAQAMVAPWAAFMANAAGAMPGATPPGSTASPPQSALQALSQAWIDMGSRFAGATPAQVDSAFDRTYGALGDALGFSPARKLHAAWRDAVAASVAHQEARVAYAALVQEAFTQGFQRVQSTLAEKANAGERIDSILALIRMWAIKTEEVVHETLQSERGLAATAGLTRTAVTYRKKMQHVAAVVADVFDMATRRELDDAYREIQALKREVRRMRPVRAADSPAPKRRAAAKSKGGKGARDQSSGAGE
jgi:hypothetical protein